MRLFTALVPPPDVLAHLGVALRPWTAGDRGSDRPVRWTEPDMWHVTLAFYGELPDGALPELVSSLEEGLGAVPAPTLRLRGAGSFAGRTLRVGVAGVAEADTRSLARLLAVAKDVAVGLTPTAEPRERNKAHLTVARAAQAPRQRRSAVLDAVVRALSVYESPSWHAGSAVLVRSRLGEGRRGGPLHEVVAELQVGAPPGEREGT